jgi:hypothetical protein
MHVVYSQDLSQGCLAPLSPPLFGEQAWNQFCEAQHETRVQTARGIRCKSDL